MEKTRWEDHKSSRARRAMEKIRMKRCPRRRRTTTMGSWTRSRRTRNKKVKRTQLRK